MSSFAALGLSEKLLNNLIRLGFDTPTAVQERTIPILTSDGGDLIALAQTGTGKTAAFGLPLVELLNEQDRYPQALVIAPTRELCMQITDALASFTQDVKRLNVVAVYGGASIVEQIRKIKAGAHIVAATPGRLIDLLERKALDLSRIRIVVLDEADEMLNMGFKEDIDTILSSTSEDKRVWLFSATMPSEVRQIASNYMQSPAEVSVASNSVSNENITHQYVYVEERDKYEALKRIVDYHLDIFGVIFCRTKLDSQNIAEQLITDGYNADALHGDLTQAQRDKVMNSFRNRTLQLLVATDVAARGIDVNNVTHVIHMNLPDELEYYTHRSGRTARAGKQGISIAITSRRDRFKIRDIERNLRMRFERVEVPGGAEVCEKRLLGLISNLRDVTVNEDEINSFMPAVFEALGDLSKEDIIRRFTSLEFNRFLDYYRGAKNLNRYDDMPGGRKGSEKSAPQAGAGYTRLFINLGGMDGISDKGKFVAFVTHYSGIRGNQIGKIDLLSKNTFFEVEKGVADQVCRELSDILFYGRQIRVNQDSQMPPSKPARAFNDNKFDNKFSNKPKKKGAFKKH